MVVNAAFRTRGDQLIGAPRCARRVVDVARPRPLSRLPLSPRCRLGPCLPPESSATTSITRITSAMTPMTLTTTAPMAWS